MNEVYRLVYVSRNTITGTSDEIDAEISAILATARFHNARNGLTGALLFSAGRFAQVLEGPEDAVKETYHRISADPRHADAIVLQETYRSTRSFPSWWMAYSGSLTHPDAMRLAMLTLDDAFQLPSDASGEAVFALLLNETAKQPETA